MIGDAKYIQDRKQGIPLPTLKPTRGVELQYQASQLAVYEAAMTWSKLAKNPVTTSPKSKVAMACAVLLRLCEEHEALRASWAKKGVVFK